MSVFEMEQFMGKDELQFLLHRNGKSKNQMYPDSVLILDRGFASQKVFSFLLSKGLKFVVRLRHGTSIMAEEQRIIPGGRWRFTKTPYTGEN